MFLNIKKIAFPLFMISAFFLFVGCEKPGQPKAEDQSLLAIKDEFAGGHYDKVLTAIAQYEDSLETNSRVAAVILKAEALENIASGLNRKLATTNKTAVIQSAQKKYAGQDISLINGQFYYLGKDYKRLFKMETKERSWVYFHKKYLELNDPFERTGMKNESGLRNYAAILRNMIDDIGDAKQGSKKERLDLAMTLKESLLELRGIVGNSSNGDEKDQRKEYLSDLMKVAGLILSNSENKNEQLAARLIQIQVFHARGQTEKERVIYESIIKDHGDENLSVFAYAWLADQYYLHGDMGKALSYYQKASKLFTDKDFSDSKLMALMPEIDNISAYKDRVKKMAGILKTEVFYSQMMKKHKIAIIAADGVRLRKTMESGTSKNIIITLSAGDKVLYVKRSDQKETLDGYNDYWYMIRLRNGNEGWIFGKFLLVF